MRALTCDRETAVFRHDPDIDEDGLFVHRILLITRDELIIGLRGYG